MGEKYVSSVKKAKNCSKVDRPLASGIFSGSSDLGKSSYGS
jgi:hypothetical protein